MCAPLSLCVCVCVCVFVTGEGEVAAQSGDESLQPAKLAEFESLMGKVASIAEAVGLR